MYLLRIIKVNPVTAEKTEITTDLVGLEGFLSPQQIFQMEFKLNELPYLRFHIIEEPLDWTCASCHTVTSVNDANCVGCGQPRN